MLQSNAGIRACHAYKKKQSIKKAERLVKYFGAAPSIRKKHLWKDEQYMDIEKVEAHADKTLEIESEDITDRCKQGAYAIKLLELKQKLQHEEKAEEGAVDATINLILQKARASDSE